VPASLVEGFLEMDQGALNHHIPAMHMPQHD
jgi:hypothetical protein